MLPWVAVEDRIVGTTMPVLELTLGDGESIVSDSGELSWMTRSIQMRTSLQTGSSRGIGGLLSRVMGGGTLFMTEYTAAPGEPGTVAFATKVPGQILPVDIDADHTYLIHRHGFLCATAGVQPSVAFQRSLGAGLFGGTGFILQRLTGEGRAWIELSGEVVTYDLGPGEILQVHPGHVGMFDASVNFDITLVPGISNLFFGGDGIFLGVLTGPGRVWLQSLPLPNLAHALEPYLG
jgi:uncharacterized protein (AIM24 family)